MTTEQTRTGFEKWQDGLSTAVDDESWNAWDCDIQMAVAEFNRHLANTASYAPLDWQLVKTMVWVETGARNPEWKIKPMQIGVAGDPGLSALLSGEEGGELILPPSIKARLTAGTVRTDPAMNIRAGIGYLLMRLANFEYQSIPSTDATLHEVVVKSGDSLDRIARANGSTIEMLRQLNPDAVVLRPGQAIKVRKAKLQKVIVGWRAATTHTIAMRYNSMLRDPNYARKLDYALNLVRNGKSAVCTP